MIMAGNGYQDGAIAYLDTAIRLQPNEAAHYRNRGGQS